MLDRKQKYLQIALNSTLSEAHNIISQIPLDKRIIIEAGTPLIKAYGVRGIREIRSWWEQRIFGYGAEGIKPSPVGSFGLVSLLARGLEKGLTEAKRKRIEKKEETIFTPYIVADLKCMDRGAREVEIAREGGANAAVALGQAPIETLNAFIEECE